MAPRQKQVSEETMMKRKKTIFKQRFLGLKKKATELSVLCGNSVGFICYGPDNNDLHVWPENPQALKQIVSKFNEHKDFKKKNGCDLNDFSNLESFSLNELMSHLSNVESHLFGIKRKKVGILIKGSSEKEEEDGSRVSVDAVGVTSDQNLKGIMAVSDDDKFRVSGREVDTKLGFGGVFDELGYVVRRFNSYIQG